MRVRIRRSLESVTIDGPRHLLLALDVRPDSTRLVRAPVTITRSAQSWRALSEDGGAIAIAHVGDEEQRSALIVTSLGSEPMQIDGVRLPGELLLMPVIGGRNARGSVSPRAFHVVEEIGVETYLPGVIAKELISGWRLEAFQVQAVAARSYALQERWRSRRDGLRWDLEATEVDQVYAGMTGSERALRAVASTRGVVLSWQGRILRAYYSSTNGGRSASASDVWPTGDGFEFNLARPIQGYGGDEYGVRSPLYRWSVRREARQLTKRLRAFGKDDGLAIRSIDELTGIEAVDWNEFGRPSRYRVRGRRGKSWTLSAEQIRRACNWVGSSGLASVTRATRVNSGDFQVRRDGDSIVIKGRGFGHGVGMCQYGTQRQAALGRSPREILEHYYPEATLERAYY